MASRGQTEAEEVGEEAISSPALPASPAAVPRPAIHVSASTEKPAAMKESTVETSPRLREALEAPSSRLRDGEESGLGSQPTATVVIKRMNATMKTLHPAYRAAATTQGPPAPPPVPISPTRATAKNGVAPPLPPGATSERVSLLTGQPAQKPKWHLSRLDLLAYGAKKGSSSSSSSSSGSAGARRRPSTSTKNGPGSLASSTRFLQEVDADAERQRARREEVQRRERFELLEHANTVPICGVCERKQSYEEWKAGIAECKKEGCIKAVATMGGATMGVTNTFRPRVRWENVRDSFLDNLATSIAAAEEKQRMRMKIARAVAISEVAAAEKSRGASASRRQIIRTASATRRASASRSRGRSKSAGSRRGAGAGADDHDGPMSARALEAEMERKALEDVAPKILWESVATEFLQRQEDFMTRLEENRKKMEMEHKRKLEAEARAIMGLSEGKDAGGSDGEDGSPVKKKKPLFVPSTPFPPFLERQSSFAEKKNQSYDERLASYNEKYARLGLGVE